MDKEKVMYMDWLDKRIITRLLGNCRESYQRIAEDFAVNHDLVKARVDRLRQTGVIQRFTAELSQETLGVDWVLADMQMNGGTSMLDLLQTFECNHCVSEVLMLGASRYLVFAEVLPGEWEQFTSRVRDCGGAKRLMVSSVRPVNGAGRARNKYTSRGGKVNLSKAQIEILQHLVRNARISVKELSDYTGYSQRFIQELLDQFVECTGVNLTVKLNLPASGDINYILRSRQRLKQADPYNVSKWMAVKYPSSYWYTLHVPGDNSMIHYMTARYAAEIEAIVQDVIGQPLMEDVEARVVHSALKSDGRTQCYLDKCESDYGTLKQDIAYASAAGATSVEDAVH